MTLPLSISERIRELRREISELKLADKIGPRNGLTADSDRERRPEIRIHRHVDRDHDLEGLEHHSDGRQVRLRRREGLIQS